MRLYTIGVLFCFGFLYATSDDAFTFKEGLAMAFLSMMWPVVLGMICGILVKNLK